MSKIQTTVAANRVRNAPAFSNVRTAVARARANQTKRRAPIQITPNTAPYSQLTQTTADDAAMCAHQKKFSAVRKQLASMANVKRHIAIRRISSTMAHAPSIQTNTVAIIPYNAMSKTLRIRVTHRQLPPNAHSIAIVGFQNRATERVAITSAIAMESIALKSPAGNRAIATTERASSKNAKTTSYSNRIVANLARRTNPYAITLVSIRKQTSTIAVRAIIHARSIKLTIRRLSNARAVNVLQRIAIRIPICKTENASKARLSSVAMRRKIAQNSKVNWPSCASITNASSSRAKEDIS